MLKNLGARHALIITFILLAAMFPMYSMGWSASQSPTENEAAPLCYVWHARGRGGGERPSGLEIAVWNDGTVLFARNPHRPGEDLRVGRVALDSLQQLIADIERMKDRPDESYLVPSAGWILIGARSGDAAMEWRWDERISRGYGANTRPSAAYRRFVSDWMMVRVSLASVSPRDETSVASNRDEGGRFRGYDIHSPGRTTWLRRP